MKEAWEGIREKDYFSEFTLMIVATLGAFYIGEYPEGVAVMLFYTIGELFQNKAVDRVKRNIGALLDVRPEKALVLREMCIRDRNMACLQSRTTAVNGRLQCRT